MTNSEIAGAVIFTVLMNIILLPIIFIWSINSLLGMHIEFTLMNWLASWALLSSFRGAKFEVKK